MFLSFCSVKHRFFEKKILTRSLSYLFSFFVLVRGGSEGSTQQWSGLTSVSAFRIHNWRSWWTIWNSWDGTQVFCVQDKYPVCCTITLAPVVTVSLSVSLQLTLISSIMQLRLEKSALEDTYWIFLESMSFRRKRRKKKGWILPGMIFDI